MKLTTFATGLITRLGYGGLGLGLVIDSAGVPIPSEVLLPLAGFLIRQGKMSWLAVITVSVVAQTVGAAISYWIGRAGGIAVIHRFGRYVGLRQRELDHAHHWYVSHGWWVTLIGRMLPGIRTYIGYPAGIAEEPFGRFLWLTAIGSLVWTVFLVELGYHLYDRLDTIDSVLHRFGIIILAALLVLGIVWYARRRSKR